MSQAKTFIVGAVLGAIVGAAFLSSIVHFLVIGLVVVGAGALFFRGRRLVGRGRAGKRLEA